MEEKFASFQGAVTSPDLGRGKETIFKAIQWAMAQDPNHKLLVSVTDKKHVSAVPILGKIGGDLRFSVDTRNRSHSVSHHGPVVAVHVLGKDLRKLPVTNVTEMSIVPWGSPVAPTTKNPVTDDSIRPWTVGMRAHTIGGEQRCRKMSFQ